jgi:ketosteroid isomerase-like protein
MAARRKSARRKSSRKSARAPRGRKPARKRAAARRGKRAAASKRPAAAASLDALARKIVKATNDPNYPFAEFYAADVVSREATGEVFRGLAGLEQKGRNWESMQMGTTWKARNVFVKGNTICIEWDARVTLRDGRTVDMPEVALHEVRDGKIVSERYYYNPLLLAPPATSAFSSS